MIGVLASGNGTNAQNIIEYFGNKKVKVFTNNLNSGVIERCRKLKVDFIVFNSQDNLLNILRYNQISFIVLAGYLKKIPTNVISYYSNKIINIHPSLLPKYGGKGMWGMNVHKKVIENADKESGITIHYVNENYDEGEIIEQYSCQVFPEDTPESLSIRISDLEKKYLPLCISRLVNF
jgi:phosphoribosylglycinamide formyltransferase-1